MVDFGSAFLLCGAAEMPSTREVAHLSTTESDAGGVGKVKKTKAARFSLLREGARREEDREAEEEG